MRIKGSSQHSFAEVPRADIPRSSFDRSHGHKTTFDSGGLVPIFIDEALPGDTFNLSLTAFARLATPIFPIMDNMYMETFFFAVPHRLVWENWERFCGAQTNPDDSTDFLIPVIAADSIVLTHSIADYFGLPMGVPLTGVSALPFRAYSLIYNEWFRDENLIDSQVFSTGDGPDTGAYYFQESPVKRGKRHDYFTSCLPWPQKGDSVELPLGTSAPVVGIDIGPAGGSAPTFNVVGGSLVNENLFASVGSQNVGLDTASDATGVLQWADSGLFATGGTVDLSAATVATVNQLRQAFQIQKMLERDARGGTRYTEVVKAHFGVTSPDARLQRPEYLGGGSSPVIISPIAQTSETSAESPQGNLAAMGTASLNGHGFSKSFTEHCIIIGLICVRADLTYQQGLNRMWSRSTRFDFYWPALAHIGEQAVLNKEILYQDLPADELVFGYQERFAEYRYKPSQITGVFRSAASESLDAWHLAQDFGGELPVLGAAFIEENPPVARVVANELEPQFLFDSLFRFRCARPMPMFGVPGLIDHF